MVPTSSTALASMTAVILAGGLGTRLRSVVADRPKVMAEVGGRPFLSHWLDELGRQGLRRVILCTGYQADCIKAHFGVRYGPLDLVYSREDQPLGTGGALTLALRHGASDPILALNGDSFIHADLGGFYRWYLEWTIRNALLVAPVADMTRYGGVELGSCGSVERFIEKGQGGPGLVNAGVYLLRAQELSELPLDRATSLERDLFPVLAGHSLHGFRCDGAFLDIGTPESYAAAESFFTHRGEQA